MYGELRRAPDYSLATDMLRSQLDFDFEKKKH